MKVSSSIAKSLFLSVASLSGTHGHGHDHHDHLESRNLKDGTQLCGTPVATDEENIIMQRTLGHYKARLVAGEAVEDVTIPVCFHVTGGDVPTNRQLQEQMHKLNEAYSAKSCCDSSLGCAGSCSIDSHLRFAWAVLKNGNVVNGQTVDHIDDDGACISRETNPDWENPMPNSPAEIAMKTALRKGGAEVLNVFWADLQHGLLGYAYYPWSGSGTTLDGVVALSEAAPGGNETDYSEGDVLVHELGHWLGLSHTFDSGCDVSDGILDTAKEERPFFGCGEREALSRDSCPGDGFSDPVFNFMDYSTDVCKFEFTHGQALALKAGYDFRLKKVNKRPILPLERNVPSEPLNLAAKEQQVYSLKTRRSVRCRTNAQEGDADLFMNWDSPPSFSYEEGDDSCVSDSTDSEESCRALFAPAVFDTVLNLWPFYIFRRERTLYAGVQLYKNSGLIDLTITCG